MPINFNASPLELMHEDYADDLLGKLQRAGLPSASIAVEITESTSIQEEQITQRNLRKLDAAGIILCIDDFGMGSSSLSRLHAVLAKRLKIDRAFIEGLAEDEGRRTTVQMIIRLAQALKLDIVAEGVNSLAEVDFLLSQRVLKAQGYLYSRPLELAAMNEVIARGVVPPIVS